MIHFFIVNSACPSDPRPAQCFGSEIQAAGYRRAAGVWSLSLVARIVETTYFALLFAPLEMPKTERHPDKVGNSARLHLLHDRGPVMLGRPRGDP
jgi:hypothetical protein